MSTIDICGRVADLNERIEKAAIKSGRILADITLVAVSKTKPIEMILEASLAGISVFGENYAQEITSKFEVLKSTGKDIEFHFIGHLQSNKVKLIADKVSCVQTLDNLNLAEKLNQFLSKNNLRPLNVLVQVNVSNEIQKNGVKPEELEDFLIQLNGLSSLNVHGLMAIGSFSRDLGVRRKEFALLRALRDKVVLQGFPIKELSMGMSDDFELAIEEGATIVRVGSAIFGDRK